MTLIIPLVAALAVALVSNGLIWTPQRRRMSVLRDLTAILGAMPRDHPAYDRVAGDVDRASESLTEYLDRADERSLRVFSWAFISLGLAMFFASGAVLQYVFDVDTGMTRESFRVYPAIAVLFSLLAIMLGGLGLAMPTIVRFLRRWRVRRELRSGGGAKQPSKSLDASRDETGDEL